VSVEIEHKYLVRKDLWYALRKPQGIDIRQGYLVASAGKTVRIRIADTDAFLTIKGPTENASRSEYEYSVPLSDAEELLGLCSSPLIEKVRYRLEYSGKTWDVDEFFGENDGLILAEIELSDESEAYDKPAWIGENVTADPRYYNSYLSVHPFRGWE
jgi:adenylate cyclase